MPRATVIPPMFMAGPFHRRDLLEAGLSAKVLLGSRFRRIFPEIWAHTSHTMSDADLRHAARLCLGNRGVLSHISRLQELGLDIGPALPVHFTVARDLHLNLDGIMLHRTEVLPPCDEGGVSAAAAFIQHCSAGRLIDLVGVGDWLLHRNHASANEIGELCRLHPWRPGAPQARRVAPRLDERSASLKESELRMLVTACGLPEPEANADVYADGQRIAITDLLFREWSLAAEYEGRQHAETTIQFQRDISRYAAFRDIDLAYLQVTQEMLSQPRALMLRLYELLRRQGYQGPPPHFGKRWFALFRPVR